MEPLEWCRDRLLVPGNPLTASLVFAEPAHRDAILALRTAISEIAGSAEVGDVGVGQTRLDWWQQAIAGSNQAAQRHPALQALERTSVLARIDPVEFTPLLQAVEGLLSPPRFENLTETWTYCRGVGGQASRLEARLLGADESLAGLMSELGASAYLIRITRDLAMDARANRWLVPLDIQADYQVSRSDVVEKNIGPAFDGMVRTLLDTAIGRANRVIEGLDSDALWQHRHLLIHWSLDRRLAIRIARRPARILERRLLPGHAGNVWCAWRSARRLRRGVSL